MKRDDVDIARDIFTEKDMLATGTALALSYSLQQDGVTYLDNLSMVEARNARETYRNFFGGTWDIIEDKTLGTDGKPIFVGTPSKFSHIPSHVSSNTPMFDVVIDNVVVARNLPLAAMNGFIRLHIAMDMQRAGKEMMAALEAADMIMETLLVNDIRDIYGIYTICINPAENNSPAPSPGKTETGGPWRKVRRVGKEKSVKIKEIRYPGTPQEFWKYAVLDVKDNHILYRGTRETALAYMQAANEAGHKIHNMRVKKIEKVNPYIIDVLNNGYRIIERGETICIGTKEETMQYLTAGLKEGWISREVTRVEKI